VGKAMKRRIKLLKAFSCLAVGSYVLQLGGCFSIFANTALAGFPAGTVLSALPIPFAPCGTPNFQIVDENGVPQGTIENGEDDLFFFCPVTTVVQVQGGDGGDGGG